MATFYWVAAHSEELGVSKYDPETWSSTETTTRYKTAIVPSGSANVTLAARVASAALKLADSGLVKYSQSKRNTLFDALVKYNWNVDSYIASKEVTYADCSSFVHTVSAIHFTSLRTRIDGNCYTTYNIKSGFVGTGQFTATAYKSSNWNQYVPGVILFCDTHAVMVAGESTSNYYNFTIRNSYPDRGLSDTVQNCYWNSSINSLPHEYGHNCTWYAYGRYREIIIEAGGDSIPGIPGGNAGDWISQKASGMVVGNTPKVGAIVVWSNGNAGHVAVVEAISDSGDILVSNSSYHGGDPTRLANSDEKQAISYNGWESWTAASWGTNHGHYPYFYMDRIAKSDNYNYGSGYTFQGFIYSTVDGIVGGSASSGTTFNWTAVTIPIVKIEQKQITIPVKTTDTKYTGIVSKLQQATSQAASQASTTQSSIAAIVNGIVNATTRTSVSTSKLATSTSTKTTTKTGTNLLQYPSLVESPYLEIELGGVTLGAFGKTDRKYKFPNYMMSLDVEKINGSINQYTINMTYQIESGQDPNYIDKLLGKTGYNKIKILYGDCAYPDLLFKDDEALITDVKTRPNFAQSRIDYTITATSSIISLDSTTSYYPAKTAKPSDVIYSLLEDETTGLKSTFSGMANIAQVKANNLIATNDKEVDIPAQDGVSTLTYLNYLVSNMTSQGNSDDDILHKSTYFLNITDSSENSNGVEGSYFTVKEIESYNNYNGNYDSDATYPDVQDEDLYELDIGYPGNNFIMSFNVNTDQEWAMIYNYSNALEEDNYVYNIDSTGNTVKEFSPTVTRSAYYKRTTEANKNWWTQATEYPITASVTLKGLLRPVMLMSRIKINTVFYGRKHISSGLYVVTAQKDSLSQAGYRTTLDLMRLGSD